MHIGKKRETALTTRSDALKHPSKSQSAINSNQHLWERRNSIVTFWVNIILAISKEIYSSTNMYSLITEEIGFFFKASLKHWKQLITFDARPPSLETLDKEALG